MYDKIKHYHEVEHRSIRWIARKTNLNFRTIKKYLEMDQKEFEGYSDHVINRPHILEPYKDFIIGKLSLYQETPAALRLGCASRRLIQSLPNHRRRIIARAAFRRNAGRQATLWDNIKIYIFV